MKIGVRMHDYGCMEAPALARRLQAAGVETGRLAIIFDPVNLLTTAQGSRQYGHRRGRPSIHAGLLPLIGRPWGYTPNPINF